MKLFELTGVKHMHDKDIDDVLAAMREKGAYELGRGSFAIVLKHSSKHEVIKFWVKDSSYDDFINYISAHPSKYFPKLLSKPKELTAFFLRPKDFPEKIKYVRMEMLQHASVDLYDQHLYLKKMIKSASYLPKVEAVNDWMKALKPPADADEHERDIAELLKKIGKTRADFEEFYDVMAGFYKVVVDEKNNLDVHEDNIMSRGGQLVITDPVYNSADHQDSKKILKQIGDIRAAKRTNDLKNVPHKKGPSSSKNEKEEEKGMFSSFLKFGRKSKEK